MLVDEGPSPFAKPHLLLQTLSWRIRPKIAPTCLTPLFAINISCDFCVQFFFSFNLINLALIKERPAKKLISLS